jgi:hypothetical protein
VLAAFHDAMERWDWLRQHLDDEAQLCRFKGKLLEEDALLRECGEMHHCHLVGITRHPNESREIRRKAVVLANLAHNIPTVPTPDLHIPEQTQALAVKNSSRAIASAKKFERFTT